jgi:hypothetical protein
MKPLFLASTALTLVVGANLLPALAETNPPSRWRTSQALAQPVEQDAAVAVTPPPRYEYRYHYGGSPRHPRWEQQLVPVR